MKCVLLVAAAMLLQEPAKPPMAWNLKKGEKVRYEFNHKLVQGIDAETSEMELTLRVAIVAGEPRKDGAMPSTLTFEKIAYSKSRHGKSESYDSERDKEPSKDSYAQVLSKCAGKSIPVLLAPAGKFAAKSEIQKLLQAAVDALPDVKRRSGWKDRGIAQKAEVFEWLLRIGFDTPKGGPAKVNDTWETKFEAPSSTNGVSITAVSVARLKEIRAGDLVVDQTLRFEFDAGLAAMIKESSGKGSFTWDVAGGRLKTLGATAKVVTRASGDVTHSVTIALLPEALK